MDEKAVSYNPQAATIMEANGSFEDAAEYYTKALDRGEAVHFVLSEGIVEL